MECLGSETVALYITGDLAPAMRARADAHVDRCPSCRTWIARAARLRTRDAAQTTAPESPPLAWPLRGTRIGRYVVGPVVGRGAMGVVLRAEDPILGRSVALKLLHRAADGATAHAMLSAEARNLARLSDPHVVRIFDVETWCGRLVIAMELVEGTSLRRATEHATRSERLRMLLLAARGLAAAHAAGVVHRDFKPDNVLVADDGRVLVGDFGLAVLADVERSEEEQLVGTPAYMPPEQRAGRAVDARADQFAFCVTAVEILLGWRPAAIESARDAVRLTRALASLPRRLALALVRGLAATPDRRAATMDVIVSALERGARPPWGLLAATAALAAPLVLSVTLVDRARGPGEREVEEQRGDPVALGLVHAYQGASTAHYVAGDVRAARAAAHEAVRTAEASEDPAALVRALVGRAELSNRDGDVNASHADFEQAYMLARRERLDDDAAAIALALARSIDRDADRTDAAIEWLRLAETVAHDPLRRARVASTRARLELDRDELEAAKQQCDVAIAALAGEEIDGSGDVAALLRGAGRPEHAVDRYAMLGVVDDIAEVWCRTGRCRDSVTASRFVLDQLVAQFGPEHIEVALARVNVASYLGRARDAAGARVELEAAIAVLEREPVADPYALAVATFNLATDLHALGELDRALEVALVAVARTERAAGPNSANLVEPFVRLANIERALGEDAAARRHLERALVAAEQTYGSHGGITAYVLTELALHARAAADVERARALGERATALFERLGYAGDGYATSLGVVGWSFLRRDPRRARELLLREITVLSDLRERGEGDATLAAREEAIAWRTLAEAEHRLGSDAIAEALRQRAIEGLIALEGAESERVAFARLPLGELP